MKHIVLLALALWSTACGAARPGEDPRRADVVVESPDLTEPLLRAMAWWYQITDSEVAFNLVDACGADHVCERIRVGSLPADEAGHTSYPVGHPEDCTTTVVPDLDPSLVDINLAHELGHVLGLGHTDGVMTSFIDHANWKLPSEWREEKSQ